MAMTRARFVMTLALALALGVPCLGAAAQGEQASRTAEPPSRKGYVLFRSEFPDKEAIRPYGRAVVPVAAKFGGRFIVLADHPQAIEGTPDTRRLVILEFPSLEAARSFWSSPEYAEVKKLREGIGLVEAVLFEGT
jgi:uncharacterized protein (DUF1330 family)